MTPDIRVLLADDHALVRQGFRRILEDDPGITVVGEASGGAEAIAMEHQLAPDVVVMDMAMPEVNGLHAAIEILRRRRDCPILILSMHAEEQYVRNALDAGVKGYILKNALETDLTSAVRAVAGGGVFLSPEIAGFALRRECGEGDEDETPLGRLTGREVQVLRLVALGKSNKEVATMLGVSANTVAVHRTNVMNALGVHKTAELVLFAVRHGLVDPQ
jgi:DNA-binding NarL/FixJ family response regulator